MAQRLPVPGSDDNTWGDILNGFLGVVHNADGTVKTNTVLSQPNLDFIDDTNGNKEIEFVATAGTANWMRLTNSAQGSGLTIGVNGTAANENLTLAPLGTGTVQVGGSQVTTANNTQTLLNKSISGASNTLSAIPESAVTNLVSDLASKQSTITLTTTGTSGAATFSSNTLNIPNYASGGFTQAASQTANFTAAAGTFYPVNATSTAITVTLPTSTALQTLAIKKTDASTNNVTLSGTINGVGSTTLSLTRQNQAKQLIADGSGGWTVVAGDLDIVTTLATSTALGFVQLAGDLGGTAASPTTPTAVHLTGNETIAGTKTFTDANTNVADMFALKGGTTDTNFSVNVGTTVSPRSVGTSPIGAATYHDVMAFSRWLGTPTFQTSTDNTTYNAGTLEPNLFTQKGNTSYTIVDGSTTTSARWIWNNGNVAFSIARFWMLGFPFIATPSLKNITIDSSADGSAWTNRFTATGVTTNAGQFWPVATDWTSDSYVRLTITVTNSQPLVMGSIRAYTPRWGNQGGGNETSIPYSWDASANISLGMGTSTLSNGILNIGAAGQTTASKGIYFGTDTNLYRSANTTLKTDQKFVAGGGLQIGSTSVANQVWTATDVNGNGSWQTFSSSGYGRSVNAMAASATAGSTASTDYIYYWTGSAPYTLTMPTPSGNTNRYTLKNGSSASQSVATTAGNIEGTTTITIAANNSVDLISNGTNWMVI